MNFIVSGSCWYPKECIQGKNTIIIFLVNTFLYFMKVGLVFVSEYKLHISKLWIFLQFHLFIYWLPFVVDAFSSSCKLFFFFFFSAGLCSEKKIQESRTFNKTGHVFSQVREMFLKMIDLNKLLCFSLIIKLTVHSCSFIFCWIGT